MAGQKVDDIRVGLGLDISDLTSKATAAKNILAGLEVPREVNINTHLRVDEPQIRDALAKAQTEVTKASKAMRQQGIDLRPRVIYTQAQARLDRTDITAKLNSAPIKLKVGMSITRAEAAQIRSDIAAQVGIVKIGFDWFWTNPPPTGGSVGFTPGGGGGGPAGPSGPTGRGAGGGGGGGTTGRSTGQSGGGTGGSTRTSPTGGAGARPPVVTQAPRTRPAGPTAGAAPSGGAPAPGPTPPRTGPTTPRAGGAARTPGTGSSTVRPVAGAAAAAGAVEAEREMHANRTRASRTRGFVGGSEPPRVTGPGPVRTVMEQQRTAFDAQSVEAGIQALRRRQSAQNRSTGTNVEARRVLRATTLAQHGRYRGLDIILPGLGKLYELAQLDRGAGMEEARDFSRAIHGGLGRSIGKSRGARTRLDATDEEGNIVGTQNSELLLIQTLIDSIAKGELDPQKGSGKGLAGLRKRTGMQIPPLYMSYIAQRENLERAQPGGDIVREPLPAKVLQSFRKEFASSQGVTVADLKLIDAAAKGELTPGMLADAQAAMTRFAAQSARANVAGGVTGPKIGPYQGGVGPAGLDAIAGIRGGMDVAWERGGWKPPPTGRNRPVGRVTEALKRRSIGAYSIFPRRLAGGGRHFIGRGARPENEGRFSARGKAYMGLGEAFPNAYINLQGIRTGNLTEMAEIADPLAQIFPNAAASIYGLESTNTSYDYGNVPGTNPWSKSTWARGDEALGQTQLRHRGTGPVSRISMSRQHFGPGWDPALNVAHTLSHEFGHALDNSQFQVGRKAFDSPFLNDLSRVSPYAQTTSAEAFAELVSHGMMHGTANLSQQDIQLFHQMRKRDVNLAELEAERAKFYGPRTHGRNIKTPYRRAGGGWIMGYAGGTRVLPTKRGSMRVRGGVGRYTAPGGQHYGMRFNVHPDSAYDNLDVYERARFTDSDWEGHVGGIGIKKNMRGDAYEDVMPGISRFHQKRGIASAGFAMLEDMGIPVEAFSDVNALDILPSRHQTEAGAALWRSRKRFQGMSEQLIAEHIQSGRRGGAAALMGEEDEILRLNSRYGSRPEERADIERRTAENILRLTTHGQEGGPSTYQSTAAEGDYWDDELPAAPTRRGGLLGRLRRGAGGGMFSSRMPAPYWSGGKYPPNADHPGAVLVGERGPEVLVPTTDAYIIPNHMRHQLDSRTGFANGGILSAADGVRTDIEGNVFDPATNRWRGPRGFVRPVQGPADPRFQIQYPRGRGLRVPGSAASYASGQASPVYGGTPLANLTGVAMGQSFGAPGPAANPRYGPPGPGQFGPPRGNAPINIAAQGPINIAAQGTTQINPQGGTAGASGQAGATTTQTPAGAQASYTTGPGLQPSQRAQARLDVNNLLSGLSESTGQAQIGISEALQASPVRALSVAFGQIAQNVLGGRKGILERAGLARQAVNESQRATTFLGGFERARSEAEQQINAIQAGTVDFSGFDDPLAEEQKQLEKNAKIVEANTKAIEKAAPAAQEADVRALVRTFGTGGAKKRIGERIDLSEAEREDLIKRVLPQVAFEERTGGRSTSGIVTRAQTVKAQAMGLVGIVGGTMAFSAAMSVAQAGIDALGSVAANAAESMTGFVATTNQVVSELAQTTRGNGGLAGSIMSGQLARMGGRAADFGLVGQQAQRMAGAQNFQQLANMVRAERNLGTADQSLRGTFQGMNNGPLAAIGLGGLGQTPGIFETLRNNLVTPGQSVTDVNRNLAYGVGAERERIQAQENSGDFFAGISANWEKGLNRIGAAISGEETNAFAGIGKTVEELAGVNEALIDPLNRGAARAGSGRQITNLSGAALDASTAALAEVDAALANQLKALGKGIAGATAEDWKAFGTSAVIGQNMVDIPELLASLQPGINAAIKNIGRQQAFGEQTAVPTQFAVRMAANPLSARAGQGLLTNTGGAAGTMATNVFAGISGDVRQTRSEIEGLQAAGEEAFLSMFSDPQQRQQAKERLGDVKALGTEIKGLQDRAQQIQIDYGARQFNRQLMLTKRNVGDIIGLQGKQSVNIDGQIIRATKLGKLQNAQLQDEREGARVALARSRREIEFNVALSRLNTPGATPEERATRRREADLMAQEQLNEQTRQERMQPRGFEIQDIGISRDAEQAVYTLRDIIAARRIELQVTGITELIEAKNVLMADKQAMLDLVVTAGTSLEQVALETRKTLDEQGGEYIGDFTADIKKSMDIAISEGKRAYDELTAYIEGVPGAPGSGVLGPPAPGGKGSGRQGAGARVQAAGFNQTVLGPTSFIAGEAGSEHVMIMRNPKSGSFPGGGGGGTMVNLGGIHFGNVNVRDDKDLETLTRMVEKALNDQVALLGIGFNG